MTRLFAALAALAFASSSALAADLPPPMSPVYKAPPPPAPTWTGCDLNAGGGYGLWNVDHTFTSGPVTTPTLTDGGRGWLGRFGGGCDLQIPGYFNGRIVIGAFGEYDVMSLTGNNSPGELISVGGLTSPISANLREQNAFYAGARIGYLVSPTFLTYFDGGFTGTRFSQSSEFLTATGATINEAFPSFNDTGWFLGGGTEYALNFDWLPIQIPGLFLRTEYRFAQYQARNLAEVFAGALDGNIERSTPYVQTVTTSLVWRFNFNGPVVMPH